MSKNCEIDTLIIQTNKTIGEALWKIGIQYLGDVDKRGNLKGAGLCINKDKGEFYLQIGNFIKGKLDGKGI